MKQAVLIFVFVLAAFITHVQTKIEIYDISKHINYSIQLSSKVFGVKYLSDAKGAPTFINLGAAYPNQLLTVVIWKEVREQMIIEPTDGNLKNKTVIVFGKIELHKLKLQIVVKYPSQCQGMIKMEKCCHLEIRNRAILKA